MKCEPFFWPLRQGPWRTGRQVRDKSGHDEKEIGLPRELFWKKLQMRPKLTHAKGNQSGSCVE